MHIDPDHIEVRHNPTAQRFETLAGGQLSVAEYRRDGQRILFTHTCLLYTSPSPRDS